MISIAEQLLLLGLNDEKGTVLFSASTALPYGLAGAVILELYFKGKITFGDEKLLVKDPSPMGDDILDEALNLMKESGETRNAKYWVSRIQSKVKKLQNRLADKLVEQNILVREERKFLWVFPADRYPEKDSAVEKDIRKRIRSIVMNGEKPSERDVVLISLVKVCELVNDIFSREERKGAKIRIKELSENEDIARAVSAIVTEITLAITAGIVAATAASSAAH